MPSRAERRDLDPPVRLRLLEGDMDRMEEVGNNLAAEIKSVGNRVDARLSKLSKVGIGILASLVTTSLLLLANLVAGGVG